MKKKIEKRQSKKKRFVLDIDVEPKKVKRFEPPKDIVIETKPKAFFEPWRESYEKLKERIEEINPDCGRGGCLHPKENHDDFTGECHDPGCNCIKFI